MQKTAARQEEMIGVYAPYGHLRRLPPHELAVMSKEVATKAAQVERVPRHGRRATTSTWS